MKLFWTTAAQQDYCFWQKKNRKILARINKLVKDVQCNPFEGIGKPEPLKFSLQGSWSRRVDAVHRLVYKVDSNKIVILSCGYNY